ncbi:MAG: cellulase family glycosylhydrolase [Spirochaetes bacterium]|nr:cellulase family glycosylhydrolase [Spirochaetota bacterium]
MATWGARLVRLQVWPVYEARSRQQALWEAWPGLLTTVVGEVQAAGAAGLKVIIDLHEPPLMGVDGQTAAAWHHPDMAPNLNRLWGDLARALKPFGALIYGYDLLNEPLDRGQMPKAPREWRPLAVQVLTIIRAIDPQVWLIYESGPGGMCWGLEGLEPLPDARVIYSPHYYSPHAFTHQGISTVAGTDLQQAMLKVDLHYPGTIGGQVWDAEAHRRTMAPILAFQRKHRVPILIGEFSVIRWAPGTSGEDWLRDVTGLFAEYGWSWCYHAFREFHGWSLEHDGAMWVKGQPDPAPSPVTTARARVIRERLVEQ